MKAGGSLNVLMVAPTSFFSSYGCHVRIAEEADALRWLGHRVTVVTYHNGGILFIAERPHHHTYRDIIPNPVSGGHVAEDHAA